jgi:capsular polysaccharide biosynthesis protein
MEPRIMMLRRSSYRKITNIDKVIRTAEKQGFKTVAMDNLSLHDQISLIHNAEIVLSQGGAAITNLMFAGKQTQFVGLVGPALNQKKYWGTYLNVFNVNHQFLVGKNLNEVHPDLVHNDFLISINELKSIL